MKIKVNKRIKGITIAAAALVLIIVVAVMFIIVRYTPAKEKMSGYTYYGIDRNTDKVFVIIDGELYPDTGIIYEGRYYLPQEFIADNINVGFYYDTESDAENVMSTGNMLQSIQIVNMNMAMSRKGLT